MAHDLLLSHFPTLLPVIAAKDWSRSPSRPAQSPPTDPRPSRLSLTADERARLDRLATLRMRASGGDKKSRAELLRVSSKVKELRRKAARGDARAARACQVLDDSGVLGPAQKVALRGDESRDRTAASAEDLRSRATRAPQSRSSGAAEIMGEFVGDEERLNGDAGSSEQEASSRLCGSFRGDLMKKLRQKIQRRRVERLARGASRQLAAASPRTSW